MTFNVLIIHLDAAHVQGILLHAEVVLVVGHVPMSVGHSERAMCHCEVVKDCVVLQQGDSFVRLLMLRTLGVRLRHRSVNCRLDAGTDQ